MGQTGRNKVTGRERARQSETDIHRETDRQTDRQKHGRQRQVDRDR